MATFRASYYFATDDQEGWSENLYIQATDIVIAQTFAAGAMTPRLALSPDTTSMVYAKVSDVAIKGDSLIVGSGFPIPGTYTASPTTIPLEANVALLIEVLAGSVHKNRIFLRGLTADVINGRTYMAPTAFASALASWLTEWTGQAYVRTQVVPHTTPPTYTYTVSDNMYVRGVTARKPGRPFDLPRGRKFSHRHA